jgi:hypothetical protein
MPPKWAAGETLYWCADTSVWTAHDAVPDGCEHVTVTPWTHKDVPLQVNADPRFLRATIEAALEINSQLGFDLLEVDPDNDDPDIGVIPGGNNPLIVGRVGRMSDAQRVYSAVLIYDGGNNKSVLVHELLHLLGLRHDDSILSVMYPSMKSTPDAIEQQDIKLLRRLYLR